MAKRAQEQRLDDIELLNIHRYPESAAPSMVAYVRNSKAAQKRLEELLKGLPGRRGGRGSGNRPIFQQPPSQGQAQGTAARPPEGSQTGGVKGFFRRFFS